MLYLIRNSKGEDKMKRILIKNIKTRAEAVQIAIDWQNWASKQDLSYQELSDWGGYFRLIAKKFNLVREFKENCIL
jgi:hypothetical protein